MSFEEHIRNAASAATVTSFVAFAIGNAINWGGYQVWLWVPPTLLAVGFLALPFAVYLWVRVVSAAFAAVQPRTRKVVLIVAAAVAALGLAFVGGYYSGVAGVEPQGTVDNAALELERNKNATLTALLEREMGVEEARAAIAAEVEAAPLGPVSLLIRTGITPETNTRFIEALRTERRLLGLTDDERGYPFARMAIRTFAFASPGNLTRSEQFPRVLEEQRSEPENRERFELHRLDSGEFHVIVFAEPGAAASIANLDGRARHEIDTYTSAHGTRTAMVSIPVDRIISSTNRFTGTTTAVAFVLR